MARMTKTERKEKADARKVATWRRNELLADARRIVARGVCPTCGCGLRNNLAIAGWWQCKQYGAEGFRADSTKPACSFQTFTE